MVLYKEIAEQLALQIKNGHFKSGDRIFSRKELCKEFNISGMTAVRVHDELKQMGIVRKIKGRGVFVTDSADITGYLQSKSLLKKIVFFKFNIGTPSSFCHQIFNGIEARAMELNIDLRGEFINPNNISEKTIEFPCSPKPDEGYIVIASGPAYLLTGALLLRKEIRTVFIDSIMVGTDCVLTDNFSGMEQIVAYLTSRNITKIIFAQKFCPYEVSINESERALGYKMAMEKRFLQPRFIDSGSFNDLIIAIKDKNPAEAIMFPQDDVAIKFKEIMLEAGIRKPIVVTGFDDFTNLNHGIEKLITVRVDHFKLGTTAVDLLLKNSHIASNITPDIVRVPCKLIVRNTDMQFYGTHNQKGGEK